MSDDTPTADLIAELYRCRAEWDELRADLEGVGGSPGERLIERMDEIETTLSRRGIAIPV